MPTTIDPNISPGYVAVSVDQSGKKIGNYAIQMYVDNNDGVGPVLQTVYLQNVVVTQIDENGNLVDWDDLIDYEWKRQLLDEMRAIRIGMEQLLETGRPSFDPQISSLIDDARRMRLPDEDLSQEA